MEPDRRRPGRIARGRPTKEGGTHVVLPQGIAPTVGRPPPVDAGRGARCTRSGVRAPVPRTAERVIPGPPPRWSRNRAPAPPVPCATVGIRRLPPESSRQSGKPPFRIPPGPAEVSRGDGDQLGHDRGGRRHGRDGRRQAGPPGRPSGAAHPGGRDRRRLHVHRLRPQQDPDRGCGTGAFVPGSHGAGACGGGRDRRHGRRGRVPRRGDPGARGQRPPPRRRRRAGRRSPALHVAHRRRDRHPAAPPGRARPHRPAHQRDALVAHRGPRVARDPRWRAHRLRTRPGDGQARRARHARRGRPAVAAQGGAGGCLRGRRCAAPRRRRRAPRRVRRLPPCRVTDPLERRCGPGRPGARRRRPRGGHRVTRADGRRRRPPARRVRRHQQPAGHDRERDLRPGT